MKFRYHSAFPSVIPWVVKYLLRPVLVEIVLETRIHRNPAPWSVYFCWAELVFHISNWVLKKREMSFCVSHMFFLAIRRDLKKRVATEVISGMEWFYGKELHHTFQKNISHMWWEREVSSEFLATIFWIMAPQVQTKYVHLKFGIALLSSYLASCSSTISVPMSNSCGN